MSVPVPDPDDRDEPRPSLLERLTAFLTREPEDRGELLDLLRGAFERRLLDADALSMIEGVLQVSEMSVRDVMIPRSQMDCVSIDDEPAAFIPLVIETKHSRFPVIGESKDDVVGILLAKELLNYYRNPEGFTLRFTLVIVSPSGARNVSYEGMNCSTGERRLYAFGRPGRNVPSLPCLHRIERILAL